MASAASLTLKYQGTLYLDFFPVLSENLKGVSVNLVEPSDIQNESAKIIETFVFSVGIECDCACK